MKNLIFSLVLFMLTPCMLMAQQPSWVWVTPYPTGQQINQVYFLNELEGFVLGDGTLMRTSDGGDSWQLVEILQDVSFMKVVFVDAANGWVLGRNLPFSNFLRVFKTSDGGAIWEEQNLPLTFSGYQFGDIFFLDQENGWIVGENGLVYSTSDGGSTWANKSITTGIIPGFYFVHFTSSTTGLALGRAFFNTPVFVVARTTDGGDSWEMQSSGLQNEMRAAKQISETSLVTVGLSGLILQSHDSAATWSFPMGLPTQNLNAVDFYNELLGLTVSDLGTILRTNDGGLTWQDILSGFSTPLSSVQFLTESIVVAGGSQPSGFGVPGPNILFSTDGGNIWSNKARSIEQPFAIFGISFSSPSRGWVAGANYIYGTADGGETWDALRVNLNEDLRDIVFVDSAKGFAVGSRASQSLILRTTNGGTTWQSQTFANIQSFHRVTFPTVDTGFVAGDAGAILKTTNGGQSWTRLNTGTTNGFFDVDFISTQVGWVPDGNSARKTTDGGATWTATEVSSFDFIGRLSFPNVDVGYAAGNNFYKTTDGGLHWEQLPAFFSNIRDLLFIDDNRGWAITNDGIIATSDGGFTWQYQLFLPFGGSPLFRLAHLPDIGLWVGGTNASVLKYTGDVVVSVEQMPSISLPKQTALHQNFPNPFNPSTVISYELPKGTHVILTIHNVLGQEVARLIDQKQNAGSYNVNWNASGQASGVYFYRLQAEGFEESKRMIVVQ